MILPSSNCTQKFGGGGGIWTRVRQSAACNSTCLEPFIDLTYLQPNGQDTISELVKNLTMQSPTNIIAIQIE